MDFFVFILLTINVLSQDIQVLDKETGRPINNVTIFTQSESFSSFTKEDGKVDISDVGTEQLLIFSHISYAIKRIKKSQIQQNNMIVYLTRGSEQLDEVVLSVFKGDAKANRIAEQIAVVTAKDIEQISPQTSADILAAVPG